MKRLSLCIIVLAFAVGCQSVESSLVPTQPAAPTHPVSTQLMTTPSVTPSPVTLPTEAATITPVSIHEVSLESPTLWRLYDMRIGNMAPLLADPSGGLRLDPGWEVARVEFVYQWWGMGDPILINHVIDLRDGQYLKDDETVISPAQIAALVQELRGLFPTQGYLESTSHTDDYPSWDVELVGADGTHILIHSGANSNLARTPWNVFVNGRFYAQYDGRLAGPLAALFDERLDPDLAHNEDWDDNPLTQIPVEGSYWPVQFIDGFTGLLPIAGSFHYYADAELPGIVGYINGRNIIGFSGLIRQGSITDLAAIYLEAGGQRIDCAFELVESDFEFDASWEFTCPLTGVRAGDAYEYPIFVQLATAEGEPVVTEGVLTGTWGAERDMLLTSGPEPLLSLLEDNEQAGPILENHTLVYTNYHGTLELGQSFPDSLAGTMIFVGQVSVSGTSLRYTLTLPFRVEGGELVYWTARRGDIEALLFEVFSEPVTWQVVNSKPDAILNLWYSVYDDSFVDEGRPLIPGGIVFQTDVCPGDGIRLPSPETPLRAFGFDQNWDSFQAQFIINEQGEVFPGNLVFRFWDEDPLVDLLLPDTLIPSTRGGLDSLVLENGGSYNNFTVYISDDVSEEDYYALREWAESLPFTVNFERYETIWHTEDDIGYWLNESGKIEFRVCGTQD